jgi:hypothetical protein
MTTPTAAQCDLATRLVVEHTCPPVVALLYDLGFPRFAGDLETARSLSAVRYVAADMGATLRRRIRFRPLRSATTGAVSALHGAALLGLRGDVENAAVMALGAHTRAARAQAWRRRWWQLLRWRTVYERLLARVRAEQLTLLAADQAPVTGELSDPNDSAVAEK